ncbi:MAG TPA: hypothetical protein VJG49_03090 [Candidatus Nanoarchaeia archaeon]|nr:hypothetical protein [Candidatus Nanoarchaeia archaeon]
MVLLPGYTVGDELGRILQLADEKNPYRSITYAECSELLEQKLGELFPWMIDLTPFCDQVKTRVSTGPGLNYKDYCYGLAAAGVKLGRVFAPSSDYSPASHP